MTFKLSDSAPLRGRPFHLLLALRPQRVVTEIDDCDYIVAVSALQYRAEGRKSFFGKALSISPDRAFTRPRRASLLICCFCAITGIFAPALQPHRALHTPFSDTNNRCLPHSTESWCPVADQPTGCTLGRASAMLYKFLCSKHAGSTVPSTFRCARTYSVASSPALLAAPQPMLCQ